MKRRIQAVGIVVILSLIVASPTLEAHAADRDPNSFVWYISDTGFVGQDSALAMSRGAAWPVVFGELDTITLRPVEGPNLGSFWHPFAPGLGSPGTGPLRAAANPDGSVAGVADNSTSGLVISSTGSLTYLDATLRSLDYSPSGALVTAEQYSVTGFSYDGGGPLIDDIAVSPFGDGGVVRGLEFYDSVTDQTYYLPDAGGSPTNGASLTYDAMGRPHVIYGNGTVYDFDTISATWTAGTIGTPASFITKEIAADSTGVIGTAFVEFGTDDLIYAYWSASAGWNTTVVDTGVDGFYQIGLDFDYDDLPVISYVKGGTLHVAYDPIVVPEPSVAMLIAGLGGLMLRRREWRR